MDIINLSPEPDDDFLQHIRDNMKDEYKDFFVKNHMIYLKYKNTPDAFVVDLDDVWEWIGFKQKNNAVQLLKKNFKFNEHYNEENLLLLQQKQVLDDDDTFLPVQGKQKIDDDKQHGGHNKIIITMTVNTFKKLCLNAKTSRSEQIYDYYIHIENLFNTYIEKKRIEYNNKLMIEYENNMKNQRHELLTDKYDNMRLVYVMKMFDNDDKSYVIKIGSSIGIGLRCKQINAQYKVTLKVLEVYPCELFKELESTLHHHPNLLKHKYKELINNIKPNEFYKISDKRHYDSIIKTIKEQLPKFKSSNKKILTLELKNKIKEKDVKIFESKRIISDNILKLSDKLTGDQLFETIKLLLQPSQSLTELQPSQSSTALTDSPKLQSPQTKLQPSQTAEETVTLSPDPSVNGPRVQVYDKDDITKLLHVFEGITEAMRHIPDSNMSQIKKAVKSNKLHAGYRWYFLNRNDPTYQETRIIPPTKYDGQQYNRKNIALLNLKKTEIVKIFNLQKEVADYIDQSTASVSVALKFGNMLGSQYYCVFLEDVNETLLNKYLETNQLPEDNRFNSKKVERIDPDTNEVLETLNSITEVHKKYTISTKVLVSCTKTNKPYKGFKWKII